MNALTKKDFESNQDVRWCPGCGDYAILAQIQKVLPTLGIPREDFAFISGIGCSSRFPYYMETYGMHSIHGRAPAIATGLKVSRPELSVWVVTGDGDALAIGGNHFIHAMRRNIGLKIILLNNRIYGLTKGQYSPTSEFGKKTKTTPLGSIDRPFSPVSLALGAGATFVARSVDVEQEHLNGVLRRAAEHKGTAFVEIFQNCNIFNDGAYGFLTDKNVKAETRVLLEHGKPLLFGKDRNKGLRLRGLKPEVVTVGENGVTEADLLVHDERDPHGVVSYLLTQLDRPDFPVPLGVFRCVDAPSYEELNADLEQAARAAKGRGELAKLLNSGETWVIT
ncbi:MAG: 2-oxoacid:ferredoxin oxidoreductase subunit beta [Pseudomonadota bacterium]|jgi:2-oxoglutarate ferredoxin oxidoreductase subunit beta